MPRRTNQEKRMHIIYNRVLDNMEKKLGNDSTYSDTLDRVSREQLGKKFHGVYPSDRIPKLTSIKPYAIINTDKSSAPGSHWVGVGYNDHGEYYMIYDSFGRKTNKIMPEFRASFNGRVLETDSDAEQRMKENNCGQRSLAWLICVDSFGFDMAKLI